MRTQLNGYQLNHSTIKTVLKHLPGLLHAIDTYYPCFFDLDANLIAGENGAIEYPIVAIRKQSNDPHHPLLRENYRRAHAYSEYESNRYKELYGVNIQDKASLLWRAVFAPVQEWWSRTGHDHLSKLKPKMKNNYPEEPFKGPLGMVFNYYSVTVAAVECATVVLGCLGLRGFSLSGITSDASDNRVSSITRPYGAVPGSTFSPFLTTGSPHKAFLLLGKRAT